MSPSSLRTFPSFGALLRAAWDLFRARFWKFAALVLAFNLGMLAVQVSAFGAAAWQSFLDYLDRGGSASLGIIPSVGAASGVSLLVVVPVALVSLFLQLWFLASLVALVEYREGAPSFRALLREGWREGKKVYKRTLANLSCLSAEVSAALEETAEFRPTQVLDTQKLSEVIRDPPIAKIVSTLLEFAIKLRASDVHIEPLEEKTRVRYRIDGILSDEFNFPKVNQQAVIARLKIISGLDITESRLPQDGRIKIRIADRMIDGSIS